MNLLLAQPILALLLQAPATEPAAAPPSADEIMARLEAADLARRQSMTGYVSVREYSVENQRFHVRASMQVEVTVEKTGQKHFRILKTSGPAAVRKLVFQRMLDTEQRASDPASQAANRISRANYTFRLAGSGEIEGRKHYILEAEPKSENPLLFRGRVWIDATHYAVARIEGAPARNPSFWVKKTSFVHENAEFNGQWLPRRNRSDSQIRIFGRSTTTIVYGDPTPPSAAGTP
jgi:hypothetical protein